MKEGTRAPSLPEFNAVCEFITRRVLQGVTGEMTVKQAMDTAASETETFPQGSWLLQIWRDRSAPHRVGRQPQPAPGSQQARWLFLAPSAAVLGCVMLFPLGYAIVAQSAELRSRLRQPGVHRAGQLSGVVGDARLWDTLSRTLGIVLSAVGLEFCLGLLIAYGLYRLTFGVRAAEPAAVPAEYRHAGRRRAVPAVDFHRALGPRVGLADRLGYFPA